MAPRGMPQVEDSFDIDANGILGQGKDKTSGRNNPSASRRRQGLSDADVEKMRKDAEVNAESDKQKKELIEAQTTRTNSSMREKKRSKSTGRKWARMSRKNVREKIDACESRPVRVAMPRPSKSASSSLDRNVDDRRAMSKQRQQTPPPGPPKDDQKAARRVKVMKCYFSARTHEEDLDVDSECVIILLTE